MIQNKIKRNIKSLLLIIIVFLFPNCSSIHNFDLFVASDDSMAPQINTGDHVIIHKSISNFDYGDAVAYCDTDVIRGEVYNYLWRIVALPGDNISIKEDMYTIKGKLVHYRKTNENILLQEGCAYDEYEETMPNGKKILILSCLPFAQKTDIDEMTVPKDRFYLLSDRRSGSLDSRFVGALPKSSIKGKAIKVIKDKNFFKIRWTFYKYALWGYKKEDIESI